ncbi:MAG: biopolymer transporter ExbD [Labilithrix sp.]|nr:biopolymer transporter ExbD [Labilithrix sp.]
MGAGSARAPSGAITGINVTPLVDVTLVLLIIFMVTAKIIVRHDAMTVDLPKAASGAEVQEIFSLVLAPNAPVQLNGEPLGDDDEILMRARSALERDKALRAVIKADGAVPHRRVMHVLDLLKRAGVSKIGFGVVPEPPAAEVTVEP